MGSAFWQQVVAGGLEVPTDRPLVELTAELTTMLGGTDPALRDATAYSTLSTWLRRGVYDDLLAGLGDGMAAGLEVGLGERGTDTVFRRSFSVLVLGECVARDNEIHVLTDARVLEWGDRIATWFVREQDLRGFVPGKGWAHAAAHGADAIGALARSRVFGLNELTVLLDVLADRLLRPTPDRLVSGEPDRLAAAVMAVLQRDVVPLRILEPWVARLAAAAVGPSDEDPAGASGGDPWPETFDVQAFLRALHLQLALGPRRPDVRPDLLLVVVDALRSTDPQHLLGG